MIARDSILNVRPSPQSCTAQSELLTTAVPALVISWASIKAVFIFSEKVKI